MLVEHSHSPGLSHYHPRILLHQIRLMSIPFTLRKYIK